MRLLAEGLDQRAVVLGTTGGGMHLGLYELEAAFNRCRRHKRSPVGGKELPLEGDDSAAQLLAKSAGGTLNIQRGDMRLQLRQPEVRSLQVASRRALVPCELRADRLQHVGVFVEATERDAQTLFHRTQPAVRCPPPPFGATARAASAAVGRAGRRRRRLPSHCVVGLRRHADFAVRAAEFRCGASATRADSQQTPLSDQPPGPIVTLDAPSVEVSLALDYAAHAIQM
mmetsp:Transcript_6939/g.19572  ORF Transcript_6939/g.19572 Transcript_6939/m.19572 type:complete len:228 (-) Transcript_6939:94-777(-)